MLIEKLDKDVEDYFRNLVNKEFQGYAGIALKYLCDLHKGICPNGHEEIELKLDYLQGRIEQIQEQISGNNESKKERIKGLAGNTIK